MSNMSCSSNCFKIEPFEAPVVSHDDIEEALLLSSYDEPLDTYVYRPVKPAQTRVLRLHPTGCPPEDDAKSVLLHADMITVNLHILEGVMVEGTNESIGYTTLSYSWGHPELSETLICDGKAKLISRDNAAALRALRKPLEATYLWIDALCINQEDKEEKSQQVAQMLAIYQKAQTVIAWLGESDSDSLLAFACMSRLTALEEEISSNKFHQPACFDRLRAISISLTCLFGRPWLSRTWVRQEIYGARQLIVQCGTHRISWTDFTSAATLISTVRSRFRDHEIIPVGRIVRIKQLMAEAQMNATMPASGAKSPRGLIEVLRNSSDFALTDPRDTVYAVLGMCKVPATTKHSSVQLSSCQLQVMVDYSKPLVEVYNDAAVYIFEKQGDPRVLAELWHCYKRSPLHTEGLVSWATDWRAGLLRDGEPEVFDNRMKPYRISVSNRPGTVEVDDTAAWIPLWTPTVTAERTHRDRQAEFLAKQWHWPTPLRCEQPVLLLKARVINCIAHVTEFTCDVSDFISGSGGNVGLAGRSIHAQDRPDKNTYLIRSMPEGAEEFDPEVHSWRLAVLGVANNGSLSLVPASAKKCDLVVAIAPRLFPMVIRCIPDSLTTGGLFELSDPYDEGLVSPRERTLFSSLWLFLNYVLVASTFAMIVVASCAVDGASILRLCSCCLLAVLFISHLAFIESHLRRDCGNDRIGVIEMSHFIVQTTALWTSLMMSVGMQSAFDSVVFINFGISMATILCGVSWRYYLLLDQNITIAIRRKKVLAHLDNATKSIGKDYEFHGPMIVANGREHWRWNNGPLRTLMWRYFRFVVLAGSKKGRRPYTTMPEMEALFKDVLSPVWYRDPEFCSWNRSIQEFRLH